MKTKMIILLGIVLVAMPMLVTSADAKTYNNFAGHSAVQYYSSDIGSPLNKYIQEADYDTAYSAKGVGVRLYLTSMGKDTINSQSGSDCLSRVMDYVTSCSEWRSDRSYVSVATEIAIHCEAGKISPMNIEYLYNDLDSLEQLAYGR